MDDYPDELPKAFGPIPEEDEPSSVEINMADGVFIKTMQFNRPGILIKQHSHKYDHTSLVGAGAVKVWLDDKLLGVFHAGQAILIGAHTRHQFLAIQQGTIVYCIHNFLHSGEVEIDELPGLTIQTRQ
jgi:quercetin dioxygenase-like cupin family protein